MIKSTETLWQNFENELSSVRSSKDLEQIRVAYLGKKSPLTALLKSLGQMAPQERRQMGEQVNSLKQKMSKSLSTAQSCIAEQEQQMKLHTECLDATLPGTWPRLGSLHPVTQVAREVADIFLAMGFFMASGPEMEEEFYNFEALNVPAHHPARDMQDTFFLDSGQVLRTQTSPVQIRTMESMQPPIKMIALGKVYRRDADVTHSPMFTQMEGLVVGEGVNMADLKGTLIIFANTFFGKRPYRFRPSFFPFTEPSAEMDIQCIFCGGKGCSRCKQSGWMEILGCGMVHPKVFEVVNYDSEKYTGFAFGMGIERIAMQRYGIPHIQHLYQSDIRFLRQF